MKTWFITGASGGLGAAIAEEALTRGYRVAVTARSPEKAKELLERFPQTALAVPLDVLDAASITRAVQQTLAWSGSIDILVNNAGRGLHGAIEEVSDAEARSLFDINFFSLLAVTREILPIMRRQKRGHILTMSSAGGLVGGEGSGIYAATKFAVEGITEAMAVEVAPLGIHVTALEPGPFRTEFAGRAMHIAKNSIADYAETAGKRAAQQRANHGTQPGDPKKAARLIVDMTETPKPPVHLCIGPACYGRVRAKIATLLATMEEWEARGATATDY